jgi:hypothetical protein
MDVFEVAPSLIFCKISSQVNSRASKSSEKSTAANRLAKNNWRVASRVKIETPLV